MTDLVQQAPEGTFVTGSSTDGTSFTSNLSVSASSDNAMLLSNLHVTEAAYRFTPSSTRAAGSGQTVLRNAEEGILSEITGHEQLGLAGSYIDTYSFTNGGHTENDVRSRVHTALVFEVLIPEPASLALLATGGLLLLRRAGAGR